MPAKKKAEDATAAPEKAAPKKAAPKKSAPLATIAADALTQKQSRLLGAAASRAGFTAEEAVVALLRSHLRKGTGVMALSADMRRFSR